MVSVEGPRLDEQLCFALYAASNSVVRAYRPLLARIGLTYPQYLVMMVLWEDDGCSVQQLADRLDQPAHGMAPIIRRLTDAGLVTREIDRTDRRVARLRLTPSGRDLGRDAAAVQADVACGIGLDEASYDRLRDTLRALPGVPGDDLVPAPAGAGGRRSSVSASLLASAEVAAYQIDVDGQVTAMSPAASVLLHWPDTDLIGLSAHDTLHHSDEHGVPAPVNGCPIQAVHRHGKAARADRDTFWRRDGAPVPVWWTAIPTTDEASGIDQTLIVFDRLDPSAFEVGTQTDTDTRLLVLGQLSELLGVSDVEEGLNRVAALGAGTLADWCVIDRVENGRVLRAAIADRVSAQPDLDIRLRPLPTVTPRSSGSLGRVLRGVDTVAIDLFLDDEPLVGPGRDELDVAQAELFADLGAAHAFVVPLRARNQVLGAMTWVRKDPAEPFTDTDVLLATVFGFRVGLWLDNARLYAEQKRVSETLQRSLLTALPEPDHLQIGARYAPAAEGLEVGGDWYDAIVTPDGCLAVTIGDVTGHDSDAAARMSQLRTMVRFALLDDPEHPESALRRVDAAMPTLAIRGQATAIAAVIGADRRITWTNAGHLPPLLIGPDGVGRLLDTSPDLLLGVRGGTPRHTHDVVAEPGSTLVLYTDGLIERRGETLDDGLRRLIAIAGATVALPVEQFCDALLERLVPLVDRSDDVALIAIRFDR